MRALTALIFADDRPGHYHLSDGIIAAMRRLRPVKVIRIKVARRWSGRLLSVLSNTGFPAGWMLRLAFGLSPTALPRSDVIISAGAETLAANICAARITGAPNVYYGSLRRYAPSSLRLVLTSYASQCHLPGHVMVLKPSALSRESLSLGGNRFALGAVPKVIGLLLGGDSGECRYENGDWTTLLDFVEHSHRMLGVKWIVSNSRRTPSQVSDEIVVRAASAEGAVAGFIDVRESGPGTLGRLLEQVQAIVCTDDSSTMISECVSAGFPVVGARPRRSAFIPDEQAYREYLSENNWYRSVAIADLTPNTLLSELSRIRPLNEEPLDRLAAILQERLPELFTN